LINLAAEHDPGFDLSWFAEALEAIDRLPDSSFRTYGLSQEGVFALKERMRSWARRMIDSR
jgi:hypothetical protein